VGSMSIEPDYLRFPEVHTYIKADTDESSMLHILDDARPGDLLLVRTPGLGFLIGRKVTGNLYDHIAVVLEEGMTLNIVSPRTVIVPITCFTRSIRKPLLIRPNWSSSEQVDLFITKIKERAAGPYNMRKALTGVFTAAAYTWLRIRIPMPKPEDSAARWICTEAIICALLMVLPASAAMEAKRLVFAGAAETAQIPPPFLIAWIRWPMRYSLIGSE